MAEEKEMFGTYFIRDKSGKRQKYKFASKESKDFYDEIATNLWGNIPHDVKWAIGTKIFMEVVSNKLNSYG